MSLCIHEAGEMLHVAEAFLDKNYHPTVICRGKIEVFWILVLHFLDSSVISFLNGIIFHLQPIIKLWRMPFQFWTKLQCQSMLMIVSLVSYSHSNLYCTSKIVSALHFLASWFMNLVVNVLLFLLPVIFTSDIEFLCLDQKRCGVVNV